jgi:hypothetical protein
MNKLEKTEMAVGCERLAAVCERFWIKTRGMVTRDCFNFLLKNELEMIWRFARQQGEPALLDAFERITKARGLDKTVRGNGNRTRRARKILSRKAAVIAAARKRRRILSR